MCAEKCIYLLFHTRYKTSGRNNINNNKIFYVYISRDPGMLAKIPSLISPLSLRQKACRYYQTVTQLRCICKAGKVVSLERSLDWLVFCLWGRRMAVGELLFLETQEPLPLHWDFFCLKLFNNFICLTNSPMNTKSSVNKLSGSFLLTFFHFLISVCPAVLNPFICNQFPSFVVLHLLSSINSL